MSAKFHGSCLCRGVTFIANGFCGTAANCHCTMCRKFHGAAFGTLMRVTGLNWLSGAELLNHYKCLNGTIRTFCCDCGSSVGFRSAGAPIEEIELAISLFDDDISIEIAAQIYTTYKANWCELQENVSQFDEGRELN